MRVPGGQPARLAEDQIAAGVVEADRVGCDRDIAQRRTQSECGEFTDRVRQQVDTDAERAQCCRAFQVRGLGAAGMQRQRGGEPADTRRRRSGRLMCA